MRGSRIAWAITALSVIAACSSGDSDDDLAAHRDDYVAALSSWMDSRSYPTEHERDCVSRALVDVIGLERLAEDIPVDEIDDAPDLTGLEPTIAGLTEHDLAAVYDNSAGCTNHRENLIASLAETYAWSDEMEQCLADAFGEDLMRDMFIDTPFVGDSDMSPDLQARMNVALGQCAHLT